MITKEHYEKWHVLKIELELNSSKNVIRKRT